MNVHEQGRRNLSGFRELRPAQIDTEWMVDVLFGLLRTPSPSGRTDAVIQFIGDIATKLGLDIKLTRRGTLLIDLPGAAEQTGRALVVHADTIGCMVSGLKDNGRLRVAPIGTFSARFAAGARVAIFSEDPDRVYSGTILPNKASGHAFNEEIDTQPTNWDNVEVRVDERAKSRADLEALGIQIGDGVALLAQPTLSESGYINSRHLDGKAGVAVALAVAKAVTEQQIQLPVRTRLVVTIYEEIGHGASEGIAHDVAEMVSIDNAVCAPGQESIEEGVTIPMLDMHGPFDYHLTRKLWRLGKTHELPIVRDVFRYYRSDIAAAIEAGGGARAALVAFGLDASHGWERTHVDALVASAHLVSLWLQTPLTLDEWDEHPTGPLRQFPSQRQPALHETAGMETVGGEIDNVPRYTGEDSYRPPEVEIDGDLSPAPSLTAHEEQ